MANDAGDAGVRGFVPGRQRFVQEHGQTSGPRVARAARLDPSWADRAKIFRYMISYFRMTCGFPFLISGVVRVRVATPAQIRGERVHRPNSEVVRVFGMLGPGPMAILALDVSECGRGSLVLEAGRQSRPNRMALEARRIFIHADILQQFQR